LPEIEMICTLPLSCVIMDCTSLTYALTPKALANVSPRLERQRQPWATINQTK
jgi:hypothetical protein